jgi:PAS domain S-box-containing protein
LEDLKGKEILVMQGDNAEEFVRGRNISNKIITTHTFEEAFRKLAAGEGDGVITQLVMGIQLTKNLKIKSVEPLDIPIEEFRQDFCFAVKKGNTELLSRLNEGLSIVIANKTYNEIHLKWFGPELKGRLNYKEMIAMMLYILIPLIIILFAISIVFLRREVKRRTKRLQQEITDHKRTVKFLNKQQILLSEMERRTKVGGWEYDVTDQRVSWTDGVFDIFGVPKSEFDPSGKNKDLKFYHPDDREMLDSAFRHALEKGNPYDLELRLTSADGTAKWVRTAGQAEFSDGKVVRVYGNIMDITVQKKSGDDLRKLKHDLEIIVAKRTKELEEKVQKLHKSEKAMLYMVEDLNKMTGEIKNEHQKLEATNKELEAFSYSVSHDLRAPLRAMDGFARILQEDYAAVIDAEGRRLLEVITHNTKKMGMLIDDLLSFSRISRQEIKFSGIDMRTMANSVFQELAVDTDKEKIIFHLQEIPSAYGDPSMVRQVWVNLIGNAIKFTSRKPDRIIEVGSKTEGPENIYYVKDNGAGFDMAYSNKLFGVFQRLHTEKDFEGTGVGLAIVQRIILRLKGSVWAEGKINEGAAFYFSLPSKH